MGLRSLLGSAKAIHHDPGPKGESGEGDAAMVMLCLTYVAACLIMTYGAAPSIDFKKIVCRTYGALSLPSSSLPCPFFRAVRACFPACARGCPPPLDRPGAERRGLALCFFREERAFPPPAGRGPSPLSLFSSPRAACPPLHAPNPEGFRHRSTAPEPGSGSTVREE